MGPNGNVCIKFGADLIIFTGAVFWGVERGQTEPPTNSTTRTPSSSDTGQNPRHTGCLFQVEETCVMCTVLCWLGGSIPSPPFPPPTRGGPEPAGAYCFVNQIHGVRRKFKDTTFSFVAPKPRNNLLDSTRKKITQASLKKN